MAYLNANIPVIECWVRGNFLRDQKDLPDKYFEVGVFGFSFCQKVNITSKRSLLLPAAHTRGSTKLDELQLAFCHLGDEGYFGIEIVCVLVLFIA